MATEKDFAFIRYLVSNTRSQQIKWEPTAQDLQFTASFKGRYVVIVERSQNFEEDIRYWMTMKDEVGREMLRLYDSEMSEVKTLYELAERASLNVDAAIDDIMAGADDDIPF